MPEKKREQGIDSRSSVDGQLSGVDVFFALAATVLLTIYSPLATAADNWQVFGAHGELHVHGTLTESACRLETSSAWQDVPMGNVASGQLRYIGERGRPVTFTLKLEDCASSMSQSRDSYTGNLIWSKSQPSITVSFYAAMDFDNPQLIRVSGARGLGLRLTDMLGRDVRVGGYAAPIQLTPGKNQLVYTIVPERTRSDLKAGSWSSLINIGLSYQ